MRGILIHGKTEIDKCQFPFDLRAVSVCEQEARVKLPSAGEGQTSV